MASSVFVNAEQSVCENAWENQFWNSHGSATSFGTSNHRCVSVKCIPLLTFVKIAKKKGEKLEFAKILLCRRWRWPVGHSGIDMYSLFFADFSAGHICYKTARRPRKCPLLFHWSYLKSLPSNPVHVHNHMDIVVISFTSQVSFSVLSFPPPSCWKRLCFL